MLSQTSTLPLFQPPESQRNAAEEYRYWDAQIIEGSRGFCQMVALHTNI